MDQILLIGADAAIYGAWLFIVAAGLTLIYGVMKIVNMAHGSFYALGAYAASSLTGAWLRQGGSPAISYLVLIGSALLVALIVGPLLERFLLRSMIQRDEVVLLLVTYAVFLILEDGIKLVWGVNPYFLPVPYEYLGNFETGDLSYPRYSLLVVTAAVLCAGGLGWLLNRTRFGRLLTAIIHDREVSAAMGVDVSRAFLITFTLGCLLASLGGALTAPMVSVSPGMGIETIVLSFVVVVIGGLGSVGGAALGAVIIGLVRSLMVHYAPQFELFSIYIVMALVLLLRPRGLFALAEPRKI